MTEKEYIDREVVYDVLNNIGSCDADEEWRKGWDEAIDTALGMVKYISTADVEHIRHGHWILTKRTKLVPTDKIGLKENFTICKNGTLVDENNINKKAMILKKRISIIKPKCSECGYCGYDEDDIMPYCPNCGAKMDGEDRE